MLEYLASFLRLCVHGDILLNKGHVEIILFFTEEKIWLCHMCRNAQQIHIEQCSIHLSYTQIKLKNGSLINWCLDSSIVNRSFISCIPGRFLSARLQWHTSLCQASLEECLHLLERQGDSWCVLQCWMQPCDKIREGHRVTAPEIQAKEEQA